MASGIEEWRSVMNSGSAGDHPRPEGTARIYRIEGDAADSHKGLASNDVASDDYGTVDSPRDRLVFSVEEAAYLLNISRALAYELVARGEIPSIRLGRRIVIPRRQLEVLLGGPV
jgi:excisionase family DNA binding protein